MQSDLYSAIVGRTLSAVLGIEVIRHFFFVAVANLRKAPIATAANVLTLALGLLSFVVAYGVVGFWNAADRQLTHSDRTFAISTRIVLADRSVALRMTPATNHFVAEYLQADFPDVQAVARARILDRAAPISAGDRTARLYAVSVDPAFSSIFELPFVEGDASAALSRPRSVVLTKEAATRLFGAESALGKTVSFANRFDATVTGVIAAIPEPSHMGRSFAAVLPFDLLTSMDVLEQYSGAASGGPENWFGIDCQTYVLLPADGSLTANVLADGLSGFVARHAPAPQQAFGNLLLYLTPISDVLAVSAAGVLGGDVSLPRLLLLFGALILAVACVNYSNVATAQATRRAREAGVRKAIGAGAGHIVAQHLFESGLLTAVALLTALASTRLAAPLLNSYSGIDVRLALSASPGFWLFIVLVTVAVTVLAGAYPAIVLSRTQPIVVLRPARSHAGGRLLSKLLVALQFSVASFLLILLVVVYQENREIKRTIAAFGSDPLLVIDNDPARTGVAADTLTTQLRQLRGVRSVTLTDQPLTFSGGSIVARTSDPDAPQKSVWDFGGSFEFADVFGLKILAGRPFDSEHAGDDARPSQGERRVLIDSTLAEQLGFASPAEAVDQLIYWPASFTAMFGGTGASPLRVIGVTERKPLSFRGDFSQGTLYHFARNPSSAVVRIARGDVDDTVHSIDTLWKRMAPGFAVSRRFLDDIFDEQYSTYAHLDYGVRALASFALLISAAGLFAMALVVAARRTHEIGVRKTFGATSRQILLLLLSDFSAPIIVANVVAWPVAFIAAQSYLNLFANRIDLTLPLFVLSLGATLAVAWAAVGTQTLRAARANPARALRHE